MSNRLKRCKQCKEYEPAADGIQTGAGWFHTYECASKFAFEKVKKKALEKQHKEYNRDIRQRRNAIKSKADWLKQAQTAFNRYVRARDDGLPCISCDRHHAGQYHAGHYRTVGAHGELRFNLDNCHKQCAPCNNHKSGNIVEYRINLLGRIGAESLSILEGPHPPAKWSIDDIKAIEVEYKAKYKAIVNSM